MLETHDGFEIARRDLEIRGPGEFMGARQSGDALLRFADLAEDERAAATRARASPRCCSKAIPMPHSARWSAGWGLAQNS